MFPANYGKSTWLKITSNHAFKKFNHMRKKLNDMSSETLCT